MAAACSAPTPSGKPCRFMPGPTGLCAMHDPDRHEERSARGRAGAKRSVEARARPKITPRASCRLRTVDDRLSELERSLLRLEIVDGDEIARERAIADLVLKADTIIQNQLETENAQLKEMLIEKYPDLKRRMKAIP